MLLSYSQIASEAIEKLDLNFFQRAFITGNHNFGVEMSGLNFVEFFAALWLILFLLFNWGNYYSYYHSQISSTWGFIGAGVITAIVWLVHSVSVNYPKLNQEIGPNIIKIETEQINSQNNGQDKMDAMVKYTDKSGKLFYVDSTRIRKSDEAKDNSLDSDSEKPEEDIYDDDSSRLNKLPHVEVGASYQEQYVSTLKTMEAAYHATRNKEDAKYLATLFKKGNKFINSNKRKASFYGGEVAMFKQKEKREQVEYEKSIVVTPIKKVDVE